MNRSEGDDEFSARYLSMARNLADHHGFAVKRPDGVPLSSDERRRLIRSKMLQAAGALTELGQWLEDDDLEVRDSARESIHRCMQIAYTGDRPEPAPGRMERGFDRVDKWLGSFLGRFVHPDSPIPPWTKPRQLRHLRAAGIGTAFLAAVLASIAFWANRPNVAVVLLAALAFVDTIEGSFARVTRMRDPQMRWMSCVFSHVGDTVVMVGMALLLLGLRDQADAEILLVATIVSVVGSLVRVSALQAGYRFWRSPFERVVRFAAYFSFSVLCIVGSPHVASIAASALLMAFGFGEAVHVMKRVAERRVARGGFIFLTESGADCWSFDDDEDVTAESALFDRTTDTVGAVIGEAPL